MNRIASNSVAMAIAIAIAVVVMLIPPAALAWEPAADNKAQVRATAELEKYRAHPKISAKMDEAHGYAILPTFLRVAAGFGVNYGKGLVVEQDELIGSVWTLQGTIGFTYGVEYHSQIILFRDAETMQSFKSKLLEFQGRANGTLIAWGASADPGYLPGVAIYSRTKAGLMIELAAILAAYRYKPFPVEP
jgi:lipid-binding SYLF domain-containing protein